MPRRLLGVWERMASSFADITSATAAANDFWLHGERARELRERLPLIVEDPASQQSPRTGALRANQALRIVGALAPCSERSLTRLEQIEVAEVMRIC
jgi:hypothetical protein